MRLPDDSSRRPTTTIGLVGLFIFVGFALRIHDVDHSLWLDELHTAWTVDDGLAEVAPRARMGNQSPLYFYMEWALVRVLGLNETSLRWLSVGASTVFMALAAWAIWRWTASRVATVAVVMLLALDRVFIFYAQDARPYAVLHLVALAQLICVREVLRDAQRRWRIALIVTSLAMLYLHYTSGLLLVAEAIYITATWCGRGQVRRAAYQPSTAVVDALTVIVAAIPLWSHATLVASRRANWALFVTRPTWIDLATLFPLDCWFIYPALVAGAVSWLSPHREVVSTVVPRQHTTLVRCLLGIFFILLVLTWLLTRADIARVFFKRYLMVGAVAPIFATAIIGASLRGRKVVAAYFITLAVGLMISPFQSSTHSVVRNFMLHRDISGHAREDWRGAVQFVRAHGTGRIPVFVRSGFIECTVARFTEERWAEYCTVPVNNLYDLTHDGREVNPLCSRRPWELNPRERKRLTEAGRGWFILRGGSSLADETARRLVTSLSAQGTWSVTDWQVFQGRPGVCVFQLRRGGSATQRDEPRRL